MKPTVSSTAVKKLRVMMAVRAPKMKKSYHSKAVPAAEAATTSPVRLARGSATAAVMPCSPVQPPGGERDCSHWERRKASAHLSELLSWDDLSVSRR